MKTWIITHKKPIFLSLIGAFLGFAYWYFIGCASESCAITSSWWKITLYGAAMGWLVSDLIINNKKEAQ